MKKTQLLNAELSHTIATLGHGDGLTLCDAGLPIPASQKRIDLALTEGVPTLVETLGTVLSELWVERVVLAEEIREESPSMRSALLAVIREVSRTQGQTIEVEYVSHAEFKRLSSQAKAVVRTGECTPYANIILYSGVMF